MLNSNKVFGHITLWTAYLRLCPALIAGDWGMVQRLFDSDIPNEYLHRYIRYFATNDPDLSPINSDAKATFNGQADVPMSLSGDVSKLKNISIGLTKLEDKAQPTFENLIAHTDTNNPNSMYLLAFIAKLFVQSGGWNWNDIRRMTTVPGDIVEVDGQKYRSLEDKCILDIVPEGSKTSWFNQAKAMQVVSAHVE